MARMYVFREESIRTYRNADTADPNTIGRALDRIAAENNGRLETETAIARAQARSHALQRHLTWDNAVAGHKWRLQEMRSIIRSIEIVLDDEDTEPPKRAWVSADDRDGIAYHSVVDEVLTSADLQLAVLRRALRDLQAFRERFNSLREICELVRIAEAAVVTAMSARGGRSGTTSGDDARPTA